MAQYESQRIFHVLIIWQTGRGAASVAVNLETARHWQYVVRECDTRFLSAQLASTGLPTELVVDNIEQIAVWTAEEVVKSGVVPSWKNPAGATETEPKPEVEERGSGKVIPILDYQI